MMSHYKQNKGFSLIELMVVLAIMGVTLSLTGGLIFNVIEKRERIVEIKKVENIFKMLRYSSYFSGLDNRLTMQGNTLKVEEKLGQKSIYTFKRIQFVPNEYTVTPRGIRGPHNYGVIDPVRGPVFFNIPKVFKNL